MNEKEFWKILDKLDWNNEGDDDLVLKPVIKYLSKLKDEEIFAFHEIMSKLLFNIDGKAWAKDIYKDFSNYSDDDFLYTRCVAIVNGEKYYNSIKNRKKKLNQDLEFESILYVPEEAWNLKHKDDLMNMNIFLNTIMKAEVILIYGNIEFIVIKKLNNIKFYFVKQQESIHFLKIIKNYILNLWDMIMHIKVVHTILV